MPLRSYLFQDIKIKQKSIFDFGELYKIVFRWFEVHGYDFHEKEYLKEEFPGRGENLQLFWEGKKQFDTYTSFVIEINFFVIGLTSVEIEKNGLKIKTNQGDMEIRMSAYLLKDPQDKWTKGPLGKGMRALYEGFIARERLSNLETELYNESHQLIDEIKSFVSLHQLA